MQSTFLCTTKMVRKRFGDVKCVYREKVYRIEKSENGKMIIVSGDRENILNNDDVSVSFFFSGTDHFKSAVGNLMCFIVMLNVCTKYNNSSIEHWPMTIYEWIFFSLALFHSFQKSGLNGFCFLFICISMLLTNI